MREKNMYVAIMAQDAERFEFAGLMAHAKPEATIEAYRTTQDFRIAAQDDLNLLDDLKGIFIKIEDNLPQMLQLIQQVHSQKPNIFFVVLTPLSDLETIRVLIQWGVSQVISGTYSTEDLKQKIQVAESFQQNIVNTLNKSANSNNFTCWQTKYFKNTYAIFLNGWLNERISLPRLEPEQKEATLFIDCEGLRGINSVGIRVWIQWMSQLQIDGFKQIVMQNMHHVVLSQISMIEDLVPENCLLNSFYLLYYNDELDIEKEIKFLYGEDFDSEKMQLPTQIETVYQGRSLAFALDQNVKVLNFYKGKIALLEYAIEK